MSKPRLISLLALFILLVNGALMVAHRYHPFPESHQNTQDTWSLIGLPEQRFGSLDRVLSSSVWGEIVEISTSETVEHTPVDQPSEALTQEQVTQLRQQLKAIIYQEGWRVIFSPQSEAAEISVVQVLYPGDVIPESNWRIQDIRADRLILEIASNTPEAQAYFTLNLFPSAEFDPTEP
ncbi:hypothetical protein [Nitrincola tapanii]|uniref:Uncharacterized protein n=1 Tax=Nitrincola tapanii TaxID=1708751 RepID=A0A5A9W101_9GAMM|nr:hypothetical protein [Nitrincola tapanii]KAA0874397.1 hypothetical protein E1H14_08990 [Nitrincola tapanii]